MGNLLDAIVTLYTSDASQYAIDLRTALGAGRMYNDVMPGLKVSAPYCTILETGTVAETFSKTDPRPGVRAISVLFDIVTKNRATAESVMNACEQLYFYRPLTISGAGWRGVTWGNRLSFPDSDGTQVFWNGQLTLVFHINY